MLKKSGPVAMLLLISIFIVTGLALAEQKPDAVLTEKTFTFQPVWEGETVNHDFILKNNGNAPLDILKIESG